MNRAQRRAQQRRVQRDGREIGCTCEPTVTSIDRERVKAVGANVGYQIRHRVGCPLGEFAYALNRAGIVPQSWSQVPDPRCRR